MLPRADRDATRATARLRRDEIVLLATRAAIQRKNVPGGVALRRGARGARRAPTRAVLAHRACGRRVRADARRLLDAARVPVTVGLGPGPPTRTRPPTSWCSPRRRGVRQPGHRVGHRAPTARRRALPRARRDPRPRLRAVRRGRAGRRWRSGSPIPDPARLRPQRARGRGRATRSPTCPPASTRRSAPTDGRAGEPRTARLRAGDRPGSGRATADPHRRLVGSPSASATSGCSSRSSRSSSAAATAFPPWAVGVSIAGLVVGIVVLPIPIILGYGIGPPAREERGGGRFH